jgi:glycosyltransferase involved in cell wall biosynthesis
MQGKQQEKPEAKQTEKRKLRVCYVITKGNWGGAQKYVYTFATSLPNENFDVTVILGRGEILKEKLTQKNIKVYELKSLKRDIGIMSEIKSFFILFGIIWKVKPDVLHLNSPKASGLGSLVGRLLFVPKIIQTVHGWSFNENRKIGSEFLIRFFSWLTTVLCHKTIVIAHREKHEALSMPMISEKKIAFIRNGVERINFKDKGVAQNEIMSKIGVSNIGNKLWIGTISELHKNKGLEYVLSAILKINSDFAFIIIGEGEERKNIENFIMKNDLENKVFLVGFMDNAGQYLKAFDIFTLTSIKEGLPYTVLEAGLAGLPVIASNVGGVPDIIDSTNGILVAKTKTGEIKRALDYMIENPKIAKEFGSKLQQKVEKEFSVEQMIEKTIELYRN